MSTPKESTEPPGVLLHSKLQDTPFQNLVSEIKDYAVILLDLEGYILNWNIGAELIKGYAAGEIVGKSFDLFYPPTERNNGLPAKLLAEAAANGRVAHEGWRQRKDGRLFWGSVVITALHDSSGAIIGFSKLTRDLTEQRKAEERLKEILAELEEKNKTLEKLNEDISAFASAVSHDLKEPLRKISFFASRIHSSESLSVNGTADIDRISASASRMTSLIDNILTLSRMTTPEKTFETTNLNEVLDSVKSDVELLVSEKKGRINVGILPVVLGVRVQWHQIFLNLVLNALKYSRPDVPPIISISASVISGLEVHPGEAQQNLFNCITISDNGIGFDDAYRDRIFGIFERLPNSSDVRGTGLGLAIVKQAVSNHHGSITANGVPGQGATFIITLPATQLPPAA